LRFDVIELPLWVGLPTVFLLCLLTCALVLDHVREASGRRTAIEKGVALLKHWLSPAQLAQYQKYGYFEVRGGDSGKRYRIGPTHQMNVDELNEQGMRTELPIGDVMLAQKIALENDEQATLALANRGNPDQRPLRFG
jgi:hypothetical protein